MTPARLYAALGALAVVGLLLAGLIIQTKRLEAVQTEYATFAAGVEQVGKLAVAAAEKQKADDKLKKEKADAENATAIAAVRADNARLRAQRASRSYVPTAASGAASPERACFDRALLERALRDLDEGVSGLVDEGSEATVNLDTAKRWAQSP